jgi:hypothetical protein
MYFASFRASIQEKNENGCMAGRFANLIYLSHLTVEASSGVDEIHRDLKPAKHQDHARRPPEGPPDDGNTRPPV